jgi:hypothetical protein
MSIRFGLKAPPPEPKAPRTFPKPPPTLFEQLLPCSWRGKDFPASSMELSFEQDLVEHKYYGVDGASVEATGRGTMKITAEIPFLNGIVPGKNERWSVLYPTAFREFLRDFADRKRGTLVHPELGDIQCRPHTCQFHLDPQRRDGVIVSATWTETVEDDLDSVNLFDESRVQVIDLAALDLDPSETDLLTLVPAAESQGETFDSLVNKITAVVDSTTTTINLLRAKPAQVLYRIKTLQNSLGRSPLAGPVTELCERLHAAILDMPYQAGSKRPISRYKTIAPTTLAGLLCVIPSATTDDLIFLNPNLLGKPDVGAGVTVRYYTP